MNEENRKSRFSDQELEEFRGIISKKLDKARSQLEYCQKSIRDQAENEEVNLNALDEHSGSMNAEHMIQIAKTTQKYIDHLNKALERIDNKVYGICRVTGKMISKERLKAVPHATLSIEAKQAKG